jgi:hypothetical protein
MSKDRKILIACFIIALVFFIISGIQLAHGQEPSAPIKAGETITVAASHPVTVTALSMTESKPAPVIYPNPLPRTVSLAEAARRNRAAHRYAPKAVKVVNDDAPLTEEAAVEDYRQ